MEFKCSHCTTCQTSRGVESIGISQVVHALYIRVALCAVVAVVLIIAFSYCTLMCDSAMLGQGVFVLSC